jgi:uncharacterized protein (DUF952 family)
VIFHLTDAAAWTAALKSGFVRPPSLLSEGFIHLSTAQQVVGTANRFFAGRQDLLLLGIEERLLPGPVKYEEGEPGQLFPHFYGPLPTGAVLSAEPFVPGSDGQFRPPG